jgi:hypothetical protein
MTKDQEKSTYDGLHEIAGAILAHGASIDQNTEALVVIGRQLGEIGANMVTPQVGDALQGLAALVDR